MSHKQLHCVALHDGIRCGNYAEEDSCMCRACEGMGHQCILNHDDCGTCHHRPSNYADVVSEWDHESASKEARHLMDEYDDDGITKEMAEQQEQADLAVKLADFGGWGSHFDCGECHLNDEEDYWALGCFAQRACRYTEVHCDDLPF